jgi:hypothetical protein
MQPGGSLARPASWRLIVREIARTPVVVSCPKRQGPSKMPMGYKAVRIRHNAREPERGKGVTDGNRRLSTKNRDNSYRRNLAPSNPLMKLDSINDRQQIILGISRPCEQSYTA